MLLNYLLKCGFELEARKSKAFFDNAASEEYVDGLAVARLHPNVTSLEHAPYFSKKHRDRCFEKKPRPEIKECIITVKDTVLSDYEAVSEIFDFPLVIYGSSQVPHPSPQEWKSKIEFVLAQPNSFHLSVFVGEQLVGTLVMIAKAGRREQHVAEVRPSCVHTPTFVSHVYPVWWWDKQLGICIRDDFHGIGCGNALMSRAMERFQGNRALRRIELGVNSDNHNVSHTLSMQNLDERNAKSYDSFPFLIIRVGHQTLREVWFPS
jgi:hypothetical protein